MPEKRSLTRPSAVPTSLNGKIARLSELKDDIAILSEQAKDLQADIIDAMDEAQITDVNDVKRRDGTLLRALRVQGSSLVYDEAGLAKALGAKLWEAVSTRVLDRKKLEAFMASGEVEVKTVVTHSEEKWNAPYVRITKKN